MKKPVPVRPFVMIILMFPKILTLPLR